MVSFMDHRLKPIRGALKLALKINPSCDAQTLLTSAVAKLQAHDVKFLQTHEPPHVLLYHDGTVVNELPEGGEFSVGKYKDQVGKEYGRITLYVASKANIGLHLHLFKYVTYSSYIFLQCPFPFGTRMQIEKQLDTSLW